MNKIEIIAQELALPQYSEIVATQNYPAIAQLLNNKPLIPNPEPQATVPKRLTLADANTLFAALTDAERLELAKLPGMYERITNAFGTNNRILVEQVYLTIKSLLSLDSQTAIESALNQTELDPNYQAQIPGISRAEELNIYPVNEHEVQAALNPIGVLEDAPIG